MWLERGIQFSRQFKFVAFVKVNFEVAELDGEIEAVVGARNWKRIDDSQQRVVAEEDDRMRVDGFA